MLTYQNVNNFQKTFDKTLITAINQWFEKYFILDVFIL